VDFQVELIFISRLTLKHCRFLYIVKDTSGCAVEVHDSREQANKGLGNWGIVGSAGQEKCRTDQSISFGAHKQKKGHVDGRER
jgi:hypothetical protein